MLKGVYNSLLNTERFKRPILLTFFLILAITLAVTIDAVNHLLDPKDKEPITHLASQQTTGVCLTVSAGGLRIASKNLTKIFSHFCTTNLNQKRSERELYITYNAVLDTLAGKIDVAYIILTEGTNFTSPPAFTAKGF